MLKWTFFFYFFNISELIRTIELGTVTRVSSGLTCEQIGRTNNPAYFYLSGAPIQDDYWPDPQTLD